jgi:lipid II:glycine glycyltransferase (peptidoglycan interpeptide bridge formation enzyme)
LQFESIKKNEAYLLLGYLSNKLVSGSLILYGKTKAYYGVGVYDRKLMAENIAVGHSNILASIYHAKKIGLDTINLGYISSLCENEKEKNIYSFKSGFTSTISTNNRNSAMLTKK